MGLIENPKFFGTTTVPPAQKFTFAIKSTTEKANTTTPTTGRFRFPTTTPTMIRRLNFLISVQVNHEHHPKRTALRPPHSNTS